MHKDIRGVTVRADTSTWTVTVRIGGQPQGQVRVRQLDNDTAVLIGEDDRVVGFEMRSAEYAGTEADRQAQVSRGGARREPRMHGAPET